MADSSIDSQTRKIAAKKPQPGKEFENYQEAQNQLLAIQAEQKQNLAMQAQASGQYQMQRQTMAEAAQVMALNPQTQQTLGRYGLNQPKVIKETKVIKQAPNITTINNTTNNINQGPVQGRDVSINQDANQGRFKAWLSNTFARQDAQFQKQQKEYEKRESALTRNSNKMMKKIEGLSKDIGKAMDPRNIASRLQNPMINLLKTIGLLALVKRIPHTIDVLGKIESAIRGFFDGDKIKSTIKEIFTGSGGVLSGIWDSLRDNLHNESRTGILDKVVDFFEKTIRRRVDLANVSVGDLGKSLDNFKLGNLFRWLQVFLGGERMASNVLNKDVEKELIGKNAYVDDGKSLRAQSRKGGGDVINNTTESVALKDKIINGSFLLDTYTANASADEFKSFTPEMIGELNSVREGNEFSSERAAENYGKYIPYLGEGVIFLKDWENFILKEKRGLSIAALNLRVSNLKKAYRATLETSYHIECLLMNERDKRDYQALLFYFNLLMNYPGNRILVFSSFYNRFSSMLGKSKRNVKCRLVSQYMNSLDRLLYASYNGADWVQTTGNIVVGIASLAMAPFTFGASLLVTGAAAYNLASQFKQHANQAGANIVNVTPYFCLIVKDGEEEKRLVQTLPNKLKDRWGKQGSNRFDLVEIDKKDLIELIKDLTNNPDPEKGIYDYSSDSQIALREGLNKYNKDGKIHSRDIFYDKDYDSTSAELRGIANDRANGNSGGYGEIVDPKEFFGFDNSVNLKEAGESDYNYNGENKEGTLRVGQNSKDPETEEKGKKEIHSKKLQELFGSSGDTITSDFYERRNGVNGSVRFHKGIDISNEGGSWDDKSKNWVNNKPGHTVTFPFDGTVDWVDDQNKIMQISSGGYSFTFRHILARYADGKYMNHINNGLPISGGTVIGRTVNEDGMNNHIHVEMRKGNDIVNPYNALIKLSGKDIYRGNVEDREYIPPESAVNSGTVNVGSKDFEELYKHTNEILQSDTNNDAYAVDPGETVWIPQREFERLKEAYLADGSGNIYNSLTFEEKQRLFSYIYLLNVSQAKMVDLYASYEENLLSIIREQTPGLKDVNPNLWDQEISNYINKNP